MSLRISALAMLLLALLLTGCGQSSSSGATLTIWYGTDDPVERIWSQQLAQAFQHSHPNQHVRLVDYSFEDLNTKLQLALEAGDPPDLAYVTPRGPGIPAYVRAHQLLDLTAAARAHHWSARLEPGLLAQYNQPFSFLGARRGSVMAVPTSLAAVGILYNRRLLRRLHLRVPHSLAEFDAALHQAKQAGYTPLGIGNADGWLGDDWYLTLANSLVSPSALQREQRLSPSFSFQQPALRQAARILQGWSNSGFLTPDFGGLDAQEGVDLFFQGKTLFQLVSSSENPQIIQDQQQTRLSVGVFPFPGMRNRAVMPVSGYLGWVVPKGSRHVSEALSFIDSLLTPQTARFLLSKGTVPAQSGALTGGTSNAASFQADFLHALHASQPGVYLDAAPISNLNATMEANVQLLLQGYEAPPFLVKSLQEVYASHGNGGSSARIDGEF
jgi:raffinose/stachyose/melibiose transport system substrate-binding protein